MRTVLIRCGNTTSNVVIADDDLAKGLTHGMANDLWLEEFAANGFTHGSKAGELFIETTTGVQGIIIGSYEIDSPDFDSDVHAMASVLKGARSYIKRKTTPKVQRTYTVEAHYTVEEPAGSDSTDYIRGITSVLDFTQVLGTEVIEADVSVSITSESEI